MATSCPLSPGSMLLVTLPSWLNTRWCSWKAWWREFSLEGMKERSSSTISLVKIESLVEVCGPTTLISSSTVLMVRLVSWASRDLCRFFSPPPI